MLATADRKRWLTYILIGLAFGVVDWYFLDLLATAFTALGQDETRFASPIVRLLLVAIVMGLNFGVWLVPVIPAAIYEVKRSRSLRRAALAAVLIWVAAIFGYYTFYAFLLMFVGAPHLEFMLFSNRHAPTYWADWWPPFRRVILNQFIEWIGIAVIGGALTGALSAYLYNFITHRRAPARPATQN